jgi:hypothetical protein
MDFPCRIYSVFGGGAGGGAGVGAGVGVGAAVGAGSDLRSWRCMVLVLLVLVLVLLIGISCGAKSFHQISKLRTQGVLADV